MSRKSRKRPGSARPAAAVQRVQELRRSAAASPIPSGRVYSRRSKYQKDW